MERFSKILLCALLYWSSINNGFCLDSTKYEQRICVIEKAKSYIGVREATGQNDGVEVEYFLRSTGLGKGFAWCVAFLSSVYSDCKVKNPRSAWSPDWGKEQDVIWKQGMPINKAMVVAKMGDVFTMFYPSRGRIAHGGMIWHMNPAHVVTIEGNTNEEGSREGDGVYVKKRRWTQIYRITCYI